MFQGSQRSNPLGTGLFRHFCSLKLAISQRLVKKLSPRCPIEEPLPAEERLVLLGIKPDWLEGVRENSGKASRN
jgi:hypothetical protein